jgi:hypothetical protein
LFAGGETIPRRLAGNRTQRKANQPDPKSKRDNRKQRKSRRFEQPPESKTQISHHVIRVMLAVISTGAVGFNYEMLLMRHLV